jgi:hypothetical protein
MDSFSKYTQKVTQIFGHCLPRKSHLLNRDKNVLGNILGHFSQTHLVTLLETEDSGRKQAAVLRGPVSYLKESDKNVNSK